MRYLILMLVVLSLSTIAFTQNSTTWEYRIEQKCFDEKRINELGADGWELAGFDEQERGGWHCIFKRRK